MGTSSSGGGPQDKTPLLQPWALSGSNEFLQTFTGTPSVGPGEGIGSENTEINAESGGGTNPNESSEFSENISSPNLSNPVSSSTTNRGGWSKAKRSLGALTKGSDQTSRKKAGRDYVGARGGASNASRSSVSARRATKQLGGFLADVSLSGIKSAFESLGLENFIGKEADIVFGAILDKLSPEGLDIEEVSTRDAIGEALAELFDEYVKDDGNLEALEKMTPESISSAIEISVVASIFNRWLGDLGRRIEEKAVTPEDAVKLERDIKSYIKESVSNKLVNQNPLKINWKSGEGIAFVDAIYYEAYSLLEGA